MCSVLLEFVKRQPVLGNPPLKLALAQMRFPRVLGLGEADVRPLQRAFAERYPRPTIGRAAEAVLTPSGVAASSEAETIFQFRSDDEGWTVTLTPWSVSLETRSYVDFLDFAARWDELLAGVADELGVARQDRIGLRYINELPCPSEPAPADIRKLIRNELVGAVGAHDRTQRLVSSMHEQRFAQDAGVCTLRHGLVVKGPEEAAYLLDMDFYDDQPIRFDREQQLHQLANFNHGAFELFHWSVPPALFASFDPQEPSDG